MTNIELWGSKKGTSLVEVLVVMVVLVVGILTVIQMFPGGFGVLKAAESQTIATRLAQQELERWKAMAANLPDGIVPVDENGNVINDQDPGPPFEAYLEDGAGGYTRGNALNVRQVIGETTPIPMASKLQTGGSAQAGSRYALGFGPVDIKYDPSTGQLENLVIKSGDLGRVVGEADSDPPYLKAGQYAVDYELEDGQDYSGQQVFHVAFPKDSAVAERRYYISYSYLVSETADEKPEVYSVVSQSVHRSSEIAVSGDDGDWIEVPVDTTGLPSGGELVGVERFGDTCARGFIENQTFYPDASAGIWHGIYEFYIADSLLGIVAFNPAGHGLYESTARGVKPIQARIDYQIYDLRIIREDRVIPKPGAGVTQTPIKMALRFIMDAGDPVDQEDGEPTDNPGEPTFEGLVSIGSGGRALSAIVIDLATGLRVNDPGLPRDGSLDTLPMVEVDYKPGVIKLPVEADLMDASGNVVAAGVPLAGRHLRFYYRAEGDWTVQCTKAYSAYTRKTVSGDPSYRQFKFNYNTNRLLFARCDIGKTVLVDYTYVDADGVEHKVAGESHKIDVDTSSTSGAICVDLNVPYGSQIPRGARIVVVGASFSARVIWRDKTRWRNVDLDTYLTRQ